MSKRARFAPLRRTKIVATLGPASADTDVIRSILEAGANMIRINGSHGDHTTHRQSIQKVRDTAEELGRPVGIMFDLQGPKIRVGKLADGPVRVRAGDEVVFAVRRPPEPGEIPTDYDLLDRDVEEGHPLLIEDGAIATQVIQVREGLVRVSVKNDGSIASRKGVNLPTSIVSAPAVTEKDQTDALFALDLGVDVIAMSFVRRPEDVLELKGLIQGAGETTPVIAKIEKPQALENLRDILEVSWGVMVARGDLGVELPPEDVPLAQKHIIREANQLGRPVITATQMLQSMTEHPRPTRAEASDVANAVLDGTDAVMLSQETAIGQYPTASVEMMARIIIATERGGASQDVQRQPRGLDTTAKAVVDAAATIASTMHSGAIVAMTQSGQTAVLASQRRARTPIFAFTPKPRTRNLLSVVWGVDPYDVKEAGSTDRVLRELDNALLADNLAQKGDRLVVLMGTPATNRLGPTNMVMIHHVGTLAKTEGL
ncbi:MAG: pyruvate kinase [Myxococcota bacterium]